MQSPFLPSNSCLAFVLGDMTAFVMRLLLFLYIALVIVTFSAPIWAYSALPSSVTSVPWFFFSSFLSPSLSYSLASCLPLGLFFSTSSSLFCLGSFEPLDFSVVFCLPFPGYQALDGVTKGIPVGPGGGPSRPCPGSWTGAAQVCSSRGRARWPHLPPSTGMPSGGSGAARVHLCVDVWCANGGAWSACS